MVKEVIACFLTQAGRFIDKIKCVKIRLNMKGPKAVVFVLVFRLHGQTGENCSLQIASSRKITCGLRQRQILPDPMIV